MRLAASSVLALKVRFPRFPFIVSDQPPTMTSLVYDYPKYVGLTCPGVRFGSTTTVVDWSAGRCSRMIYAWMHD